MADHCSSVTSIKRGSPMLVKFEGGITIPCRNDNEWQVRIKLQYSTGSLSGKKQVKYSRGEETLTCSFQTNDGITIPLTTFTAGVALVSVESEWMPIGGGASFHQFEVTVLDEDGEITSTNHPDFYAWMTVEFREMASTE